MNFYRYKNNFEKYVGNGGDNTGSGQSEAGGVVKTIASPKLMSKLSPI